MKAKVLAKSLNLRDATGAYQSYAAGAVVDVIRTKEYDNLLRKGVIGETTEAAPKGK